MFKLSLGERRGANASRAGRPLLNGCLRSCRSCPVEVRLLYGNSSLRVERSQRLVDFRPTAARPRLTDLDRAERDLGARRSARRCSRRSRARMPKQLLRRGSRHNSRPSSALSDRTSRSHGASLLLPSGAIALFEPHVWGRHRCEAQGVAIGLRERVRALPEVAYKARPALACIIGACRAWTVEMISSDEIPAGRCPSSTGMHGRAGAGSAAARSPHQQFHSVGMPDELVRGQAAAHPSRDRHAMQLKPRGARRPGVAAGGSDDQAE